MNGKTDSNIRDDAATSVVGEILLMALVIILVSLFAASAFDLLPGDRQSAVDVSMSYDKDTKTISFWHKGGDWIYGKDLTVTVTDSEGKKYTLTEASLTDYQGDEGKLVFDLGGCYTATPIPDEVISPVSIRLTSANSVLYAQDGVNV